MISVIYIVAITGLNPFIHSLRNKEMKEAFKRLLKRKQPLIGGRGNICSCVTTEVAKYTAKKVLD